MRRQISGNREAQKKTPARSKEPLLDVETLPPELKVTSGERVGRIAGIGLGELVSAGLLEESKARVYEKKASARDGSDAMSVWELCELASRADFYTATRTPLRSARDRLYATERGGMSSRATEHRATLKLGETLESQPLVPINDISSEMPDDDDESLSSSLAALIRGDETNLSSADCDGDLDASQQPPRQLWGSWTSELDDGLGSAKNPQVQLKTSRLSLLRVEMRADVSKAGDHLQVWALVGTRWGQRVKYLVATEKDVDKQMEAMIATSSVSGDRTARRQSTNDRLRRTSATFNNVQAPKPDLLSDFLADNDGSSKKNPDRVFEILASASSVAEVPGPLRVSIECEVKTAQTVTLVLARGRCQEEKATTETEVTASDPWRQVGDRRESLGRQTNMTSTQSSERNEASGPSEKRSNKGKASDFIKVIRPDPEVIMDGAHSRIWGGWQSKNVDQFELRLWTSSPLSKGPAWLGGEVQQPKIYDESQTAHARLARLTLQHKEMINTAESVLWKTCDTISWQARQVMNAEVDPIALEIKRLDRGTDRESAYAFSHCHRWGLAEGKCVLLDCVGKELGIPDSIRVVRSPRAASARGPKRSK